MEALHVFVDEYGDANLDTSQEGVSSTYIVVGLCVWESKLPLVISAAEEIRKKFFQSGEMKSSAIGQNVTRRLEILRRLARINSFAIAFCAQKNKIHQDSSLQYKKTFIKFFARKLYERLSRYSDNLVVKIDRHGSNDFQNEFRAYLHSRFRTDLFRQSSFDSVDSKNDVMIQAADVLAGSLARVYDVNKISDRTTEIETAIRGGVSVTLWPEGHQSLQIASSEASDELNERIQKYCVGQVENYIAGHQSFDSDFEQKARLEFLEILLAHHAWSNEHDFISTKSVLRELNKRLSEPMTVHKFRSSVVAKLRDSEIVISSCSRGYKIPNCYSDVREFLFFANTIIPPMISRVEMAWRAVREATMGDADVLSEEGLEQLRLLVNALR